MHSKTDNSVTWEDYKRAESFIAWNILKFAFKTKVRPNWINDSDQFWYLNQTRNGNEFILVDPESNIRSLAFDHKQLAESLSDVAAITISANYLPFETFRFTHDKTAIEFNFNGKFFKFDLKTYQCSEIELMNKKISGELLSPNGQWTVFLKSNNLFLRSISTNEIVALTKDGKPYNDYGTSPECNTHTITDRLLRKPVIPIAIWSPDSKKFVTMKIDQRKVKNLSLLQSTPYDGTARPVLHSFKYAIPGDQEIPKGDLIVFDIEQKKKLVAKCEPLDVVYWSLIEYNWVWWNKDSTTVYFVYVERHHKKAMLYEMNVNTGEIRKLLEENASTFVEIRIDREAAKKPNIRILNGGNEFIWWSQRDGWGHLYLYDGRTGKLKNQITSGEWVVVDLLHVDEKERKVYFIAGGKENDRDPYYRHLYSVKLDGTDLLLLTPEDADHDINFSPSKRYFIDTFSQVNSIPISVLRSADGKLISKLEEADLNLLFEKGWKWPEPFKTKARDGKTDIFGVIYYPSTFTPEKLYPIVDYIYPGPQRINTPKSFPQTDYPSQFLNFWTAQTIAELGFIVIVIDGFGTPYRSKTFHDYCYNNFMDGGGLEDHIIALKQLKEKYQYLDLERVGIFGHSGGGRVSARAILMYPDFYKVAVSSAGDHDQDVYLLDWSEKYLDESDPLNRTNASLANNLKGKLLLVHGEMDDNVHPAHTMKLVNALIDANKDFDMLILPNRNHLFHIDPYFIRKRWDYFVQHLLGQNPPKNYKIKGIDPMLLQHLMNG